MVNRIRINCKKVYDNGMFYLDNCEKLSAIQKELNDVSDKIDEIWGGIDNNNFLVSFKKHIKDLDQVINFLEDNGDLLKKNALAHSGIDNNFTIDMERSDIDE